MYKDVIYRMTLKQYADQVDLVAGTIPMKPGLLVAPHPTKVIKRGEMYKKGAINTGWKKRTFIALNRADNFEIEYAEDVTGNSTKGRINCFGYVFFKIIVDTSCYRVIYYLSIRYNVEIFSEDDIAKHGFSGFSLTPTDATQRKWFFRCDAESDHNEWIEVLND